MTVRHYWRSQVGGGNLLIRSMTINCIGTHRPASKIENTTGVKGFVVYKLKVFNMHINFVSKVYPVINPFYQMLCSQYSIVSKCAMDLV